MTASTPTSWRSAPGRVHRRDAAAAGADHDRAVLEQPADRPDLEDPLAAAATATTRRQLVAVGLDHPALLGGQRVAPRPRRRPGRRTWSGRRTPGRPGRPRPSSGSSRAAARSAAGCPAPARGGSRSSPRSRAPRTSSGYASTSLYAARLQRQQADLRAVAVRDDELVLRRRRAASAGAATRTLARWCSAVIGSPRSQQGVAAEGDDDAHRVASLSRRAWRP